MLVTERYDLVLSVLVVLDATHCQLLMDRSCRLGPLLVGDWYDLHRLRLVDPVVMLLGSCYALILTERLMINALLLQDAVGVHLDTESLWIDVSLG